MSTTTRIPPLKNDSYNAMSDWYGRMAKADLLFHPDDAPQDIVLISNGARTFDDLECEQLDEVMSRLFSNHGNKVYEAAYPYFMKTLEPLVVG
jgi:hypothetical protein